MNPERMSQSVYEVASAFGYSPTDLHSRFRFAGLAWARQVCWAVLHSQGATYSEIARYFGRDHSTVIYGVRKVNAWREGEGKRSFAGLFA